MNLEEDNNPIFHNLLIEDSLKVKEKFVLLSLAEEGIEIIWNTNLMKNKKIIESTP